MAKKKASANYECRECGRQTVTWVGRCPECQAWGSVVERGTVSTKTSPAAQLGSPAQSIIRVDASRAEFAASGISELDRVLGGGFVPGAVILMAGEPGVGKSTLLLHAAAAMAQRQNAQPVLYLTGEESAAQVRKRAERVDALDENLYLAAESDLSQALAQISALDPGLLILDSVQTLSSADVDGAPGGVTQIREVTAAMIEAAKSRNMTTILVGHVTKDGGIAGPRMLEHLVDVVCQFEGDRHSRLRLLRSVKNRYGPTDDVGCFDLTEGGLIPLSDPSGLFVSGISQRVPGTCITMTLEGRRPLAAEVQALIAESTAAQPRRAVSGLDSPRVSMLLAVLQRRVNLPALMRSEAYVATVGGVRITEPAADLAIALAIASAVLEKPMPAHFLACGEVGLAGEVRAVTGLPKRLHEAARLGFTHAIVPKNSGDVKEMTSQMRIRQVESLPEALDLVLGGQEQRS